MNARLCLVALLILAMAGTAFGRERLFFRRQPCPPVVCPVEPIPVNPVVVNAPVKTYEVNFDKTPWDEVLKWFAKESHLRRIDNALVNGTLTLKSDEKYKLSQLIDLLNEVLAQKDWVIIRRENTFLLHQAGVKIPPELLQQITLEELKKRGNTEFVQVVIPLDEGLVASEIAPQAKKLLSAFGEVEAFGKNQLIIRDKVKNIKNIYTYTRTAEEGSDCSIVTYTCKNVPAESVAIKLGSLLADKPTKVEIAVFGDNGQEQKYYLGSYTSVDTERYATVQITADARSNRVIISGPKNKKIAAVALLKDLDQAPTPRPEGGEPLWKTFEIQPKPDLKTLIPPKMYKVSFKEMPWSKVIDWLAKESKLILLSNDVPPGQVTFHSENSFTMDELFDVIDELLERENFTIIRREHSFLLHPSNEQYYERHNQVALGDLHKHGNREIVQVGIPLKSKRVEMIAAQAKERLSNRGFVNWFGNTLIIYDRVQNIRAILALVDDLEKDEPIRPAAAPLWVYYDVAEGKGEETAHKILAAPEFQSHKLKTLIVGSKKLLIFATPADHVAVDLFLNGPKPLPPAVSVPCCPEPCRPVFGQRIQNLVQRFR